MFGDDSGQVYSLNIEKNEGPTPIQFFYSLAILIVVVILAIFAVRKLKGRK